MAQTNQTKPQTTQKPPEVYRALKDTLQKAGNGQILQNRTNYLRVFTGDKAFAGMFQFNRFTQSVELTHGWWDRDQQSLSDHDLDNLAFYLEGYGLGRGQDHLVSAIRIIAHQNSVHPVVSYLDGLSELNDGIDYIGMLMPTFLGVEPGNYQREVMKLFGLQAVNRVKNPASKADYCLELIGDQGIGKSSFLSCLAHNPDWFSDSLPRLNNDHAPQYLWGKWLIEIAEGSALHGVGADDVKAFLSRQTDRYKIPYDRYATDFSRQCVFALTTNEAEALPMDYTGNRRFLPIRCGDGGMNPRENPEETERFVNGYWAQIMAIYRSGDFQLYPSGELLDQLRKEQLQATPEDGEAGKILHWLSEEYAGEYICSMKIIDEVFGGVIQGGSRRIGRIMDHIVNSWERAEALIDFGKPYGRQRAWRRKKSWPEPPNKNDTEHDTERVQNDTDFGFLSLDEFNYDTELPFS